MSYYMDKPAADEALAEIEATDILDDRWRHSTFDGMEADLRGRAVTYVRRWETGLLVVCDEGTAYHVPTDIGKDAHDPVLAEPLRWAP